MFDNKILLLLLISIFSAIPVVVWFILFFKESKASKKLLALIFFFGILVAPAMLGVQYIWEIYPQLDLELLIETGVQNQSIMYILIFILFGAMEEIFKHFAVRSIDKRTVAIKTVNQAVKFSVLAALGFSFAENIYYLYMLWPQLGIGELVGVYIARSGITMVGHMLFSGIFGYYFGISKFAIDITKQKEVVGKQSWSTKAIANIFRVPKAEAFKEKTILKGLFIAMGAHAIFNYLLQLNIVIPVLIFVVFGFLFMMHLLRRKVGHLVLFTDISEKRKPMIGKKDEAVVIELLGMWFNEKRYVDVMHVCERLLERDPDNNVVKLFKAKAMDKMEGGSIYKKILGNLFKSKKEMTIDDRNIISKHLEQKS
jgi:RsiW-degrading membrane proteinase PrsW (M82 family)